MVEELTRRELLRKAVPGRALLSPARLAVDGARCTGCGLCGRECRVEAIRVSGERPMQITFFSERCDACGGCVESCPEKCLTLGTSGGAAGPVVLFETDILFCERCGEAIGPEAMIERIRSRLGQTRTEDIALCPSCKGSGRG